VTYLRAMPFAFNASLFAEYSWNCWNIFFAETGERFKPQ
jgi:hypothetical protein